MSCHSGRAVAVAIALASSFLLGDARTAYAHPTPGSIAWIDFTVNGARLEQDVPVEELARALRVPVEEAVDAKGFAAARREQLRAYAAAHVEALAEPGGVRWRIDHVDAFDVPASGAAPQGDGPLVRFVVELEAPSGGASAALRLHDEIVLHEVVSHYTTVYVRSDWAAGLTRAVPGEAREPRLAGTLHAGRVDLFVPRRGSFWQGMRGVVALGMTHIAAGQDHLLFLLTLVLVAPVAAVRDRWMTGKSLRASLGALLRLATAFTVGHSATLALGAADLVRLPTMLVESGIAASILVASVHALRPIFPGREALVAGGFGLVHGLAFASTLAGRDLGAAQAAVTLLGFNVGIELAQVALLALVVPWVLLVARSRAFGAFRLAGGAFGAALACAWLAERALGLPNPAARPLAWAEAHPLLLLLGLAAGAVAARFALPDRGAGARLATGRWRRAHGALLGHHEG